MPRFVFKLEAALTQRKRQEQDAQRELAHRLARLVELQNELKRLDDRVQAATEDLRRNRLTGLLDLSFLSAHRRFLGAIQRQGMAVVQKIALAQKQVDESRCVLAEAAKRRKAIEKLREKQQSRWKLEQDRKDLTELDEIGTQIGYANQANPSDKTNESAHVGRAARATVTVEGLPA